MEYQYKVNEFYDTGMLDSLIRNHSIFQNKEFDGVSFSSDNGLTGTLYVIFLAELNTEEELTLRRLVAQAGASVAVYKQWCATCNKWYEESSLGQPIYCSICNAPYMIDFPHGLYSWSAAGQKLKKWAEISLFILFPTKLASLPSGGVELLDIAISNTQPPRVQEVRLDGFVCSIIVGVNNAIWEDTAVQFSWRVVP
jgi:hypothetical protein